MKAMVMALALVQFTGPTGARIDLNAETITSIREPSAMPEGHFARGTHCIIITVSGKATAVHEDCMTVRNRVGPPHGPCTLVCGETPRR
jgi:hypothetical protein